MMLSYQTYFFDPVAEVRGGGGSGGGGGGNGVGGWLRLTIWL